MPGISTAAIGVANQIAGRLEQAGNIQVIPKSPNAGPVGGIKDAGQGAVVDVQGSLEDRQRAWDQSPPGTPAHPAGSQRPTADTTAVPAATTPPVAVIPTPPVASPVTNGRPTGGFTRELSPQETAAGILPGDDEETRRRKLAAMAAGGPTYAAQSANTPGSGGAANNPDVFNPAGVGV